MDGPLSTKIQAIPSVRRALRCGSCRPTRLLLTKIQRRHIHRRPFIARQVLRRSRSSSFAGKKRSNSCFLNCVQVVSESSLPPIDAIPALLLLDTARPRRVILLRQPIDQEVTLHSMEPSERILPYLSFVDGYF